jgi:hypothetical protein
MRALLFGLLLTSSAFASQFSMSLGGMGGGWTQTYYNCDSLQDLVAADLAKLGATATNVNCSGGLDTWGQMPPMPAFVTASFDAPVSTGTTTRTVSLRSRMDDSCAAHVSTFDNALPLFSNIKVLSRSSSCDSGRFGRWAYDLEITE